MGGQCMHARGHWLRWWARPPTAIARHIQSPHAARPGRHGHYQGPCLCVSELVHVVVQMSVCVSVSVYAHASFSSSMCGAQADAGSRLQLDAQMRLLQLLAKRTEADDAAAAAAIAAAGPGGSGSGRGASSGASTTDPSSHEPDTSRDDVSPAAAHHVAATPPARAPATTTTAAAGAAGEMSSSALSLLAYTPGGAIESEELELLEPIGRGAFGVVYKYVRWLWLVRWDRRCGADMSACMYVCQWAVAGHAGGHQAHAGAVRRRGAPNGPDPPPPCRHLPRLLCTPPRLLHGHGAGQVQPQARACDAPLLTAAMLVVLTPPAHDRHSSATRRRRSPKCVTGRCRSPRCPTPFASARTTLARGRA
jgi:hypothetical protein